MGVLGWGSDLLALHARARKLHGPVVYRKQWCTQSVSGCGGKVCGWVLERGTDLMGRVQCSVLRVSTQTAKCRQECEQNSDSQNSYVMTELKNECVQNETM